MIWRNTHPYIVVDRHEDISNPNDIEKDSSCNRSVIFYGFIRGTHFKLSTKVHLIGVGDYFVSEVSVVPDPIPIPDKERERSSLAKKDALLYAPLSNVGAVSFDKDAVYIDIGKAHYTKRENLAIVDRKDAQDSDLMEDEPNYDSDTPAGMLKSLQDVGTGVDEKMKYSSLRIFRGSTPVEASSDSEDNEDVDDFEEESDKNDPSDEESVSGEHESGDSDESGSEAGADHDRRRRSMADLGVEIENDGSFNSKDNDGDDSGEDDEMSGSDGERDYHEIDDMANDEQGVSNWRERIASRARSAFWSDNLRTLIFKRLFTEDRMTQLVPIDMPKIPMTTEIRPTMTSFSRLRKPVHLLPPDKQQTKSKLLLSIFRRTTHLESPIFLLNLACGSQTEKTAY